MIKFIIAALLPLLAFEIATALPQFLALLIYLSGWIGAAFLIRSLWLDFEHHW